MQKEFLIDIVTRQEIEGEKEELQIMTKALFEGNENDYFISYKEEEESGYESETTLHVENKNSVTITRKGEIVTHMVAEMNVRHISHHETPYGTFSMGVSALKIDSDITEQGGRLKFSYSTDIEMTPVGIIDFEITLR